MTRQEMKSEKHCIKCGKMHTFSPSLADRGMTWKEAKSIFIDAHAGMCVDCYIKHRSAGNFTATTR